MKHLYTVLCALFITTSAMAQLPDGSVAPDFTATDIDGVEWNLYELLDAGTTVIIDFYATWCGPCWSYRATGALDDVWEELGPDGTGEVMIFTMESDDTTTAEDLAGTGSATTGDWITGTPFPMFDDCGNIFDLYENTYYPTIYTICPNHILTESGQADAAGHIAVATAASCAAASEPTDAAVLSYTGETVACAGSPTAISVELMNMGTEPLTACTIELVYNGATELSYNWTGNLDTYGVTDIQVGSHEFSSATSFEVRAVAGGDANATNNAVMSAVELATPSTSLIYVHILTDGWGEETSWSITDGGGTVYGSVSEGTYANQTAYEEYVSVPSNGCYFFTIGDSYGDGLYGEQWGSTNGFCNVASVNADLTYSSWLYAYDGDYNFEQENVAADVNTVVNVEGLQAETSFAVYPNPVSDVAFLELNMGQAADVNMTVLNLLGQTVMTENLGNVAAGQRRVELNFTNLQSGVYLVSLDMGASTQTLRVTVK
jgi:hypothetical protein